MTESPSTRLGADVVDDARQFQRGRLTAMSYLIFGVYAFYLYSSGIVVSLLRAELHFSFTVVSLASGSFAAAAIVASLAFPRLVSRAGRRRVLWTSIAGLAVGAVMLAASWSLPTVLVAVCVLSFAGTCAMMVVQGVLADHHGVQRGRALIEANVGAALCAVVAPLAFGGLSGSPLAWRACLIVPIPVLGLLYLARRREPLPSSAVTGSEGGGGSGRLPGRFWVFALLAAGGMATEMCMVFFAPALVAGTLGVGIGAAATLLVAFYVGIFVGRAAGSAMRIRPEQTSAVLACSQALMLTGVLLCWFSASSAMTVVGLLLAGLGAANMFPLAMSMTLAAAAGLSDKGNARIQLLGGSAAIVAPLALGTLADQFGVFRAFVVTPTMIVVSMVLLLAGRMVDARVTGGVQS